MRGHIKVVLAATATALLLTACTGDPAEPDGEGSDTGAPAPNDGQATELPLIGRAETTTWTDRGRHAHPVEVTPVALTRGDPADLEHAEPGDHREDFVPHYLTFEVTATDGPLERPAVEGGFTLVRVDGRRADPLELSTFGTDTSPYPPACDLPSPDRVPEGGTATICRVFLLPPEVGPLRVSYTDPGTEPLLWEVEGAEPPATLLTPGSEVETTWTDTSDDTAPLRVSLIEVVRGTDGDLRGRDGETEGWTPYRVTLEYRHEGEGTPAPNPGEGIELWTAAGVLSLPLSAEDTADGAAADGAPIECPTAGPDEASESTGTMRVCTVHPMPAGDVPAVVYFTSNAEVGGPYGWLVDPEG